MQMITHLSTYYICNFKNVGHFVSRPPKAGGNHSRPLKMRTYLYFYTMFMYFILQRLFRNAEALCGLIKIIRRLQ